MLSEQDELRHLSTVHGIRRVVVTIRVPVDNAFLMGFLNPVGCPVVGNVGETVGVKRRRSVTSAVHGQQDELGHLGAGYGVCWMVIAIAITLNAQ